MESMRTEVTFLQRRSSVGGQRGLELANGYQIKTTNPLDTRSSQVRAETALDGRRKRFKEVKDKRSSTP
jgi:hypothetical protein